MTLLIRHLALFNQGLMVLQPFGKGLCGTRNAIEHLGYIQIDTLSVVERAHHHILWSRVPGYNKIHFNQLIKQKSIFEYWYHAASYLPMADYRFALPNMASIRMGENRYYTNVDKRLMKEILARVRTDGPIRARDLDKNKKDQSKSKGSWWNWGASKRALDKLFMQGDLMVCKRKGMEKIFDLRERCLPDGINFSVPTINEYAAYLFDNTLRAHGVFTHKQLLHLKTGNPIRGAMEKIINERISVGEIKALDKQGFPNTYVDVKALEHVPAITTNKVKILSPFDNVVIHRDRLRMMFRYNYKIECYTPLAKRQFGYFCLPVLYGEKFVARIDCKAHRKEARLEVLSMHLEKDCSFDNNQFYLALNDELQKFADFNQCPLLENTVKECSVASY